MLTGLTLCVFLLCSRRELNSVVMNFLLTEGYHDVAAVFQKESGTKRELQFRVNLSGCFQS
jgi:hypothetical protein